MDRRELLGGLGVGVVGLLAAREAHADGSGPLTYHSQLDKTHMTCLDHCTACAAVCNEASHHCLTQVAKGSDHKEHHVESHHLTMDCAAMCSVSASLIARQSPLMAAQCNACAEACRRCAEACERHAEDSQIMKDCARICRACETSCRDMAKSAVTGR